LYTNNHVAKVVCIIHD